LPDGSCPHSVCCEFKLDSGDTSNQDIVELTGSGAGWGFYFDGSSWQFYGFSDGTSALSATDPFDTWHRLVVDMTSAGSNTLHIDWSVDGVPGPSLNITWSDCVLGQLFDVGAISGSGEAHRTIRVADLSGNTDRGESNFLFPTDAFTSLAGGATIDGSGFLRIDSTDTDSYGEFVTGLNMICECKCPRDVSEINSISVNISISGKKGKTPDDFCSDHGGPPCNSDCGDEGDPCIAPWGPKNFSHSWTFIRIPHDQDFSPPALEFKLYTTTDTEGCCHVGFAISPSSVSTAQACEGGTPNEFELSASSVSIDFSYHSDGCTAGFSTSTGGTARVVASSGGIVRNCSEPDTCAVALCGHTLITGYIIPWSLTDFSTLAGTNSESFTQCDAHTNCTDTIEITIA
jgi:hypothetical protein